MIEIIGSEGTAEHATALAIKLAFAKTWPGIEESPETEEHIKIAANVKLSGYKISDIDIVVVANFHKKRYIVPTTTIYDTNHERIVGAQIRIRSFIAAIEVKDHSAENMKVEAGGVAVRYGQNWKSATEQNEDQRYALLEYLKDITASNPWIYRCLLLRGIDQLPKVRGRIHPSAGAVPASFNATSLLVAMASVNGLPVIGGEPTIRSDNEDVVDLILADALLKPLIPSTLDRKRMDRIAARPTEAKELASLLGKHRVHLRGNGGTGKTILLLQSAYEAFVAHGRRCLVLTYNLALAADIQRTLALMNIPGEGDGGGIRIRTVMSFMYAWLNKLGLLESENTDLNDYEKNCLEALKFIDEEVITADEIQAAKDADPLQLDYDAILIDEAQDWPQPEADLLCRLYGGNAISLADGMSQLVRGTPTNWKSSVSGQPKIGHKHLDSGLRMKSNLCLFANAFAEEAGIPWRVSPNKDAAGGRVILVKGSYAKEADLQKSILSSALSAGNMPIDLLHCVSPSGVVISGNKRNSLLGRAFLANSWEIWDAVDESVRKQYPRSLNLMRIVQFDSCRGLEGWVTVLDGLDEFWNLKKRKETAVPEASKIVIGESDLALDAEAVAWRWCMIPITRPIDTLVIAISDQESKLAKLMYKLCSDMPDIIQEV